MSRVLVTGSRGVLGGRLLALLRDAHDHVVEFEGDVTDLHDIRRNIAGAREITHVFHLAAIVPTDSVASDLSRALQVNSVAPAVLLSCLNEAGLKPWYCHVSSSHVYRPSNGMISEDAVCNPSSLYGVTKYLGEINLVTVAEQLNMSVCVARVFSYFDEMQTGSFLYPAWKKRVSDWDGKSKLIVPSGDSVRDFSHASDIASKLKVLADKRFTGAINIGSGNECSVKEFLKRQFGEHLPFESYGETNTVVPNLEKLAAVTGNQDD